jgi:hypothetical protein
MAYTFSTNNAPATGSFAFYTLITTLVAAGWTKTQDSDGTTYSVAGTQVTSGASGANGLANNYAWFVLKHPTSDRAFCFQRGTANTSWRVSYCADNAFTAGAPSGTRIPEPAVGSVEVVLRGGGTAAAPTFQAVFAADNAYYFSVIAGGAVEGYSWYFIGNSKGLTTLSCVGFFDVLAAGSYPAADADPSVCYIAGTSANALSDIVNNSYCYAWMSALNVAANNRGIGPLRYASNIGGGTAGVGVSEWTSKDNLVPIPWVRTTATMGWKGFSGLMQWTTVSRTNMDTYNISGTRDAIQWSGFVFPWDGSIPVV